MNEMHLKVEFNNEIWNEYACQKVLWLERIEHLDYLDAKQWAIVCKMKLQKNKQVSVVLYHVTLHVNWWDNNSVEVLVVL